MRVEQRITAAGTVRFEAMAEHCIRVHAGSPVSGACKNHHFVYTRGDIDIWPAGFSDVWHEKRDSESIVLHLPLATLERVAEETGVPSERLNLAPRHQFRNPQIGHIAWALDAERRAGYPSGGLFLDSLGFALATRLLGGDDSPQRLPRGLKKSQQDRLMAYIETHLDQSLTLENLAQVAGMSASHLKVQFKRSMGVPLHAHVMERRVERAKALLASGEWSVSQAALAAGFSHQSHMARWMRRTLGVTPTALARRAD